VAREIKHLNKNQLDALGLYHQFVKANNFKTKKAKYQEVAFRIHQKASTVETWVKRWYERYLIYLEELNGQDKKVQEKFTLEGLTKNQSLYVYSRLCGKSQEESKLAAGYSPKTEASKIENNPKIIRSMSEFRKGIRNDMTFGVYATLNDLEAVFKMGINGIDEVKIVEEHGPNGKVHKREIRKVRNLSAAVQAKSKMSAITGYDSFVEEQLAQKNKEFLHNKRMDKQDQERADKRVNLDREKFGILESKINGDKGDKPKTISELREEYDM
jgi:hypothetical protein